jgi:hypothetical protein
MHCNFDKGTMPNPSILFPIQIQPTITAGGGQFHNIYKLNYQWHMPKSLKGHEKNIYSIKKI